MERRFGLEFVVLFFLIMVSPALVIPAGASPGVLQAAASTSSQGACFGYNQVNDSLIPQTIKSLRVAVIQPVFTSTPYSQYPTGSFYAFYSKYAGVKSNVTADLNWLSTNISSGYRFNEGWGLSAGMNIFIRSQLAANCGLVVGRNVEILTDMNVSQGAFFDPQSHAARFDVIVSPFSEYITVQEYLAYEDFVARGGTLVTVAHSFEYPVTYNSTTNMETLVYGHSWAFHGTYASPIPCNSNTFVFTCPWAKNNTNWMGSNTCMASCFHTYRFNGSVVSSTSALGKALFNEFGNVVFQAYRSHEENTVTNMTGTSVVSVFVNDSKNLITAYTHQYKKGTVVCLCVFADDIIATDPSAQYFFLLGIASSKLDASSIARTVATSSTSSTISSTSTSSTSVFATSTTSTKVSLASTASASSGAYPTGLILPVAILAAVVIMAAVVLRMSRTRQGH